MFATAFSANSRCTATILLPREATRPRRVDIQSLRQTPPINSVFRPVARPPLPLAVRLSCRMCRLTTVWRSLLCAAPQQEEALLRTPKNPRPLSRDRVWRPVSLSLCTMLRSQQRTRPAAAMPPLNSGTIALLDTRLPPQLSVTRQTSTVAVAFVFDSSTPIGGPLRRWQRRVGFARPPFPWFASTEHQPQPAAILSVCRAVPLFFFSVDDHLVGNGLQNVSLAGTAELENLVTWLAPFLARSYGCPSLPFFHRVDRFSTSHPDTSDERHMFVPGPIPPPSASDSPSLTCPDPFAHGLNEKPPRGGPEFFKSPHRLIASRPPSLLELSKRRPTLFSFRQA